LTIPNFGVPKAQMNSLSERGLHLQRGYVEQMRFINRSGGRRHHLTCAAQPKHILQLLFAVSGISAEMDVDGISMARLVCPAIQISSVFCVQQVHAIPLHSEVVITTDGIA